MLEWLVGCTDDWLVGWLVGCWMVEWLLSCWRVGWFAEWLVAWVVVEWLVGYRMVSWLVGCLLACLENSWLEELRKILNRKAAGLDEIPTEVWKTRELDDILFRHCDAVYDQNIIDRWIKRCIRPFPKKGGLGIAKNNWGITLTSTAAKIYNA